MNTARPLAAERQYLQLDRSKHDSEIAAAVAVAALDSQIDHQALPVVIDEHENFVTPGWTLFRVEQHGTVHLPSCVLTPAVRARLFDLMRAVEAELTK